MSNLLSRSAWKRRWNRWTGKATKNAASPVGTQAPVASVKPSSKSPHPKLLKARAEAEGIQFLVPEQTLDGVLPGADQAEVVMLPRLIRSHKWAMPEHELLTLGAIAKVLQPKLVVEFGTFRGGSTLVMAANMASDGKVITVDLDPAIRKEHEHGLGVGLSDFDVGCLFRGTRYAKKIEQRFANSINFTDRDLLGRADLVLVDADHTYEFAKKDTEKALTFLRPGGVIVWHDYTWEPQNSECAGVTRTVNEFWQKHSACHRIAGTRFAIYQSQAATAARAA